MIVFLNAWLRRWAEASLRTELHQAQEKLIRQQGISERLLAEHQRQAAANKKKIETLKRNHKKSVRHSEMLIAALRERMSDEMFSAVVAYVHFKEENKL